MYLVLENDVYKRERPERYQNEEYITFFHPTERVHYKPAYDWCMNVALEKIAKVKTDRHLLTGELLIGFAGAIREGYQHQLDPALRKQWDYPRNRNTPEGIQSYIDRIAAKAGHK